MQNLSTTTDKTTAWDHVAVADFAAGNADILVLERAPIDNLEAAIEASRIHEYRAPIHRENIGFEVRSGLAELRLKSPELATDLIGVATSFLDQFNLEEANLRIEVTQSQPCPKFHCDNVHIRLVTTYFGSTTEYQNAGDNTVHVAPLSGLVFLKGHRHPTCNDTVHHRSPEMRDGERRMCLVIDY